MGEDITKTVLATQAGGVKYDRVLRVTKLTVEGQRRWSFSIVSSNRVDSEFISCLDVGKVVWAINPLVKNYEEVAHTLEQMQMFNRGGTK